MCEQYRIRMNNGASPAAGACPEPAEGAAGLTSATIRLGSGQAPGQGYSGGLPFQIRLVRRPDLGHTAARSVQAVIRGDKGQPPGRKHLLIRRIWYSVFPQ